MRLQPSPDRPTPPLPPPAVAALTERIADHFHHDLPRFRRYWDYFRNPMHPAPRPSDTDATVRRPYRQAQEWGLPARLTGVISDEPQLLAGELQRKEIVIENDIGWRIETMVDYLVGQPIVLASTAADPERNTTITTFLRKLLDRNGALPFLQRIALLSSVHGHVDLIVHCDAVESNNNEDAIDPAARVRFELVEATHGIALPSGDDPRRLAAYVRLLPRSVDRAIALEDRRRITPGSWLERLFGSLRAQHRRSEPLDPSLPEDFDLYTTDGWQRYRAGRLVASGSNDSGVLPVVRFPNALTPGDWVGGSDVEPLVPLQDELNTRLSDRASRIALQAFRMYLARGMESADAIAVGPGQVWTTTNPDASVQELGGDPGSPSEQAHIAELREAMDKTSGVSPIAAGVLRNRIGRLTSAAAVRLTMMNLLARTERKRAAFSQSLVQTMQIALGALDRAQVFSTDPADRGMTVHWPNPIPFSESEQLDIARRKLELGVPRERVLRELGYDAV